MNGHRLNTIARSLIWQKFLILILLILYRILLDFSYKEVAHVFDYQGLFSNNKTTGSLLLSWVIFIGMLPFIINLFDGMRLSNYVLVLLVLFSLVPQTVVIAFRSDYSILLNILLVCYWLLLLLAHRLVRPIRIGYNPGNLLQKVPAVTLIVLLTSVLVYSYLTTGLRLHTDLINVYDIREEAREFGVIFPFNYILSFADNALAFFAVLLLHRRRFLLFWVTLFVIFVNFSITGTKQIVFVLLCGILGYYFIRSHRNLIRLLIFAVALIVLTIIEMLWLDTRILTTIYPYRVLFIPAELHNSYYQFFQSNELDLYRQSILKFLFESPYETNIQFLIGEYSIGDITARANNGLFSDAYMNLGALGIFLYPFIIITFLALVDGVVTRLDTRVWFVLAIYIAFVLLGMTLSTALLTAGFIPLLFIMYTFPVTNK